MRLRSIGYIQEMNKQFKKLWCQKDHLLFVIQEDLVGWYLIIYKDKKSTADYLFDSLEEALSAANEDFHVLQNGWKQLTAEDEKRFLA